MRRALAADFAALPGMSVRVMLDDRFTPSRRAPRAEYVRVLEGEELAGLARLAAEADFTIVVAPETGGILHERAQIVERAGGRWLGSSPEAIALTADKLRLGRHLAARGIATPPAHGFSPAKGLPADATFPAVVKPVDGAGSFATFVLQERAELPAAIRALPHSLWQPLVTGVPLSASFLVSDGGHVELIGVGRQRIENRGGQLTYRGGTLPTGSPERARLAAEAVAAVTGLRGFVGVDFMWNNALRQATVIEINPRLTTSYVGLSRILQHQRDGLARAWLEACDSSRESTGAQQSRAGGNELWREVHAAPRVRFDSSGQVRGLGPGVSPT